MIGPLPVRISTCSLWIGKKVIENLTWFHQLHPKGPPAIPNKLMGSCASAEAKGLLRVCTAQSINPKALVSWCVDGGMILMLLRLVTKSQSVPIQKKRRKQSVRSVSTSTYQVSSLLSCMISPLKKIGCIFSSIQKPFQQETPGISAAPAMLKAWSRGYLLHRHNKAVNG